MKSIIKNGTRLKGELTLPPSKSEAIRAALLLALAGGDPRDALIGYKGVSVCEDTAYAVSAAKTLMSGGQINVGASAALLRMILPVALVKYGEADIVMQERLALRGIDEFCRCLGVNAQIENCRLKIKKQIEPGEYELDCSKSSQYLSGLLIALPLLSGESRIKIIGSPVSKSYADMTIAYASLFGARLGAGFVWDNAVINVYPSSYSVPRPPYKNGDEPAFVSGDCSYAAFFRAANLLEEGVTFKGINGRTMQPDIAFPAVVGADRISIKNMPDLLPPLAVAACYLKRDTVLTGTARLSHKESSRAEAMARIIRSLGGRAEAGEDELKIVGSCPLMGGACDPEGDHRLAMAAAMLAAVSREPVELNDPLCVAKSAPDFWQDYTALGGEYEFIR